MIITAINAKGGVGKTTTTMFLATVFAHRGKTVTVTDLDRQGSALEWSERAEDGGAPYRLKLSCPSPSASIGKQRSSETMSSCSSMCRQETRTLSKQQSQSATSSFFRPVLLLPTSPEYGSCATQSTEHLMQSY